MNAIASGLPLMEQPAFNGRNPVKKGKTEFAFDSLLQERLARPTAETIEVNTTSRKEKQTIVEILQNGNPNRALGQEQEVLSTGEKTSGLDLLEMLTALLTRKKLDNTNDADKEDTIEAIIATLLPGIAEDPITTDGNMQAEEQLELFMSKTGDVSGQDVLELLDDMLTNTDMTTVERGQLIDLVRSILTLDPDSIEQQRNMTSEQAQRIIGQITNQKDAEKAAGPLLKLLQQWTSPAGEQNNQQQNSDMSGTGKNPTKQEQVWQKFVQFYRTRNQFVTNKHYHVNAKVTSQEVKNVLLNAQKDIRDKQAIQVPQSLSSMPISKVEQFVIHLQQQANSQPVDQQLMDQFQKVMKASKFFSLNNGTSQLQIALKPDNLGDMMVKLTQMNGEMTVKMIVSSQATKDMLESNIHQLKHLFSPNQVVIEKQDMNSQPTQGYEEEHDEQPMQEQEQHGDHQEDNQQEQQADADISFHEWLMNEKV